MLTHERVNFDLFNYSLTGLKHASSRLQMRIQIALTLATNIMIETIHH